MTNKLEIFKELIEFSQNEKRGLTIYLQGQTIIGYVVDIIDNEAIEIRSQMFSKAIVLVDSIEAIAIN